ncbi:hypothetical protein [Aerosakkonema funiforme]|uniref:hypothetical protein n=1 Tax=Aerosakkonema funiforme TaxID=1246630 RepID=UPI0035B93793
MDSQLEQEIYSLLNQSVPLIKFFGLPVELQIKALPVLEKQRRYDFPNGDLLADRALHVLLAHYHTYLSSILIRYPFNLDEKVDENLDGLIVTIEDIFGEADKILDLFCEFEDDSTLQSLDSPEWYTIRQLSQVLVGKLQIDLEVNKEIMGSFLDSRLHP